MVLQEAGDEARCLGVLWTPSKVAPGPFPGARQSTGLSDEMVRASTLANIKKKDHTKVWSFFFMERVTRLELATSTLARWRSTG